MTKLPEEVEPIYIDRPMRTVHFGPFPGGEQVVAISDIPPIQAQAKAPLEERLKEVEAQLALADECWKKAEAEREQAKAEIERLEKKDGEFFGPDGERYTPLNQREQALLEGIKQAKAQPLAELREELLSVAKKVENEGHREAAKNPNPDSAKLRFAEAAAIREALAALEQEKTP